jgi:hypothetical protein
MNFEKDSGGSHLVGFVLAAVTLGTLVAIGYAVSRPQGRSKRLVKRIDRHLGVLEQRLKGALPDIAA